MMFQQKKLKRKLFYNSIIGFIPDTILAIIATWLFDSGVLGFVLVFVGIQVFQIVIWATHSIFGWIFFWLKGRKTMAKEYCDYFHENKYPKPSDDEASIESYLLSIADNEKLTHILRAKAISSYALLIIPRTAGEIQQSLKIGLAMEDALERYRSALVRSED